MGEKETALGERQPQLAARFQNVDSGPGLEDSWSSYIDYRGQSGDYKSSR